MFFVRTYCHNLHWPFVVNFRNTANYDSIFTREERGESASQLLSRVWLFVTSWIVARQAPLSMEFSRQEYRSGYPFLLQGIVPIQGSNPGLLHCRQILYNLNHQGSPKKQVYKNLFLTIQSSKKITSHRPHYLWTVSKTWKPLERSKEGRKTTLRV